MKKPNQYQWGGDIACLMGNSNLPKIISSIKAKGITFDVKREHRKSRSNKRLAKYRIANSSLVYAGLLVGINVVIDGGG